MYFTDFIKNNKLKDDKNNSYTRYGVFYNKELQIPVLVAFETKDSDLNISMYDNDLPKAIKEQLEDGSYKDLLISDYFCDDGFDFYVDSEAICTLNCMVFDDKPVIQGVQTKDKYARHGLGSLALQLVQDYYDKIGYWASDRKKKIYASRNNFSENLCYANKIERKLGAFGELLAHSKAKVKGQQSEKAYINFLRKNNFYCEDTDFQMPTKTIRRKRNLISPMLLEEDKKQPLIQCLGDVVNLAGIIEDSHLMN